MEGLTIRQKLVLVIIAAFVVLAASNYLIKRYFVLPGFEEIESQEALKNLRRVVDAVNREVEYLDRILLDWSSWDASYAFVAGERPGFTEENLSFTSLVDLNLDFMAYYDTDRKLVWGHRLNPEQTALLPLYAFAASLPPAIPFPHHTGARPAAEVYERGILLEEHGNLLIAARPILTSTGGDVSRGTVVMGRKLDQALLDQLQQQTANRFTLQPLAVDEAVSAAGSIQIVARRNSVLILQQAIADIYGRPSFVITLEFDRKLMMRSLRVLNLAAAVALAAVVLMLVALLVSLNRIVINPLVLLTGHVVSVRTDGNYSRRLNIQRGDEIGTLAREFDSTLEHIENQDRELKRLSELDALTELANRRAFDRNLQLEWKRIGRSDSDMSLLMCDIDHFKDYNDRFGHLAGDEAIVAVGQCLQTLACRSADIACRYGGEEFAIILPNTKHEAAMEIAEKMRTVIENLAHKVEGESKSQFLTISIGIATVASNYRGETRILLEQADAALYNAKHNGRNQCSGRRI